MCAALALDLSAHKAEYIKHGVHKGCNWVIYMENAFSV